jgi:hypothetical protein
VNREAVAGERTGYIEGLRLLADFLEANPGAPVWKHGQDIIFGAESREGVDAVAAILGEQPEERPHAYRVTRKFGRITYVVRTDVLQPARQFASAGGRA